jgi:hypothetical protein
MTMISITPQTTKFLIGGVVTDLAGVGSAFVFSGLLLLMCAAAVALFGQARPAPKAVSWGPMMRQ